jgi:hypothetical protein
MTDHGAELYGETEVILVVHCGNRGLFVASHGPVLRS